MKVQTIPMLLALLAPGVVCAQQAAEQAAAPMPGHTMVTAARPRGSCRSTARLAAGDT